jgi:hypothetical protein
MSDFRFGMPEAQAVALAVSIISTWAWIRYRLGGCRPKGGA